MKTAVLDIGGTFIKSGVYDGGKLDCEKETPTPANEGGIGLMECAKGILAEYQEFDAIGISTAGQVDTDRGEIRFANENLPGYTGTRVRQILEDAFAVPVAVDNDVNMAALGEACLGAGKDQADFLCLTYGTGIGGAIVQNRRIYRGSCFSAGEFGSIVTHGGAQMRQGGFPAGIYEKYGSATALVKRAREYDSSLENGKVIFSRLEEPAVRELVDAWIGEVLLGLSSLIHIFNPSCIVLGGGIMNQPYILEELRRRIGGFVMPSFLNVRLERAQLGNRAGMLGAAIAAEELLVTEKPEKADLVSMPHRNHRWEAQ